MSISNITEMLLEGLRKEISHYHTIMDLTRRQRKSLDKTNIKGLLEHVKEKEDVINKIKEIEKTISPFREEWKTRKNEMSEHSRNECEKYVNELNSILEALMVLENENEKLLADSVNKLEKNLQNLQKGKKAQNVYRSKASQEAFFVDKRR